MTKELENPNQEIIDNEASEWGFTHRIVGSESNAVLDESGLWKVFGIMYEKISNDGENWEEASLEVLEYGKNLSETFDRVTMDIVNIFNAEVLDKGYLSIVQAKRAEEKKAELNDNKAKNL